MAHSEAGQVENGVGAPGDRPFTVERIRHVAFDHLQPAGPGRFGQVLPFAVSEVVEDGHVAACLHEEIDQMRADEAPAPPVTPAPGCLDGQFSGYHSLNSPIIAATCSICASVNSG